mmetsp:Transcript_16524/g.27309  ORF Transcript_16524/g.27309 Transcript_16524/m.27309 type:complete len:229 (+) Transcript_16524:1167-1853(+)
MDPTWRVQLKGKRPRVCSVDDPEPVLPSLHAHNGPCLPVHANDIADEIKGDAWVGLTGCGGFGGIIQVAPCVESPILQHQANFIWVCREPQGVVWEASVTVITDNEKASHPSIDIKSSKAQGMVMIPRCTRFLVDLVFIDPLLIRLAGDVMTWREPCLREPITIGLYLYAMYMWHHRNGPPVTPGIHHLLKWVGPMNAGVDGQKMGEGPSGEVHQVVKPFDISGGVSP